MNELFECSDTLNSPMEAFPYDTRKDTFPVESHWHYFMEIVFVTEGSIITICNDSHYTMKPGDMILITPQSIHSLIEQAVEYRKLYT